MQKLAQNSGYGEAPTDLTNISLIRAASRHIFNVTKDALDGRQLVAGWKWPQSSHDLNTRYTVYCKGCATCPHNQLLRGRHEC